MHNVNLVSLDVWVYSCSNASSRGFHKLVHCETLVYASVCYNNLHFSTLYLVISYNEDNAKLLLTSSWRCSQTRAHCATQVCASYDPEPATRLLTSGKHRRFSTLSNGLNPPFRSQDMNRERECVIDSPRPPFPSFVSRIR